jgi:hypothetical protein
MSCKNCTCKSKKTKPAKASTTVASLGLPIIDPVASNLDRATSVFKCPLCQKTVVGISFKYLDQQGSPVCPVCDTDMRLNGVTIDGVTQTVK